MSGPGDETSAAEGRNHGDLRASHADRERVVSALKAAFVEGRLTEDELDARVGQVYASRTYAELAEVEHEERTARASVSRSRAELTALTADLPDGITALPPTPRDVRIALGVIIAAAGVLAAVLVTNPDNALAFMAALAAIATLIVV